MKDVMRWLRRHKVVPFLLLLALGAAFTSQQAMEIDATGYRQLQAAYKAGSSAFQARAAEAMQNGSVSRWERAALLREYERENRAPVAETTGGDVAAERHALAALIGGR
ncbi:hypothetical protein [Shigella flexneri]|uniref:hypothetical protein n=1 Tax=Shigella flexneri TaxID=623 RepID=UPI003CEE2004|nr:hypothetical protein [Escherichia coli]